MSTREKTGKGETLPTRTTPRTMNPWDDMERWFDEFGRRGWLHPVSWEWPKHMEALAPFEGRMPKVDMVDREHEIVVRAELPGVNKDDMEVTLSEHSVTIEAHTTREEKVEDEGRYYRREMSRGDFQRTLALPTNVDEEKATATFSEGVLELKLPKLEKTPRRTVKVE
ncbi:MAG: Hsp20/alpha crystallin family protein [Pseudomonadota bacterium]